MIKRMNKVTSLVVAAAAVATVLPATGVKAADKLAVEIGTFYDAVAFEGGYIYNGYKNGDKEEAGVYLHRDGEDKFLEIYGSEYTELKLDENDQDYVIFGDNVRINVNTGEVSDYKNEGTNSGSTAEDLEIKALEIKLLNDLRGLDKYKDLELTTKKFSLNKLENVSNWFKYENTTTAIVYTDKQGNYIDTAIKANIPVFDGTRVQTIKEFGLNDAEGNAKTVAVELDKDNSELKNAKVTMIGQDSKYIYRIIEVEVTIVKDDKAETKPAKYLQRLSKAQGEKVKGAYVPETVESFLINEADENKTFVMENGSIVVKEGDGANETTANVKLDRAASLTGKLTMAQVVVGEAVSASNPDLKVPAVKDIDGNFWGLNKKGEIVRSEDGKNYEVVYTCNKEFNEIDVYDEESLVVWNSATGLYSVVVLEDEVEEDEDEDQDDEDQDTSEDEDNKEEGYTAGWNELEGGNWAYADEDGDLVKGWISVNGRWYYMDKTTGVMQTGWLYEGNQWYYLNPVSNGYKGAMKTGWLYEGNQWYYLKDNGQMISNKWFKDTDGRWYFLKANGQMATNTTIGGYKVGANGAWIR